MTDDELERTQVEAALETRRELGHRYDAELVDGFADRIERAVAVRVGDELQRRAAADAARASGGQRQLALGIVSLAACIPLGITLGVTGHLTALLVVLMVIVAVNYAHAWQSRRP